MSVINDVLVELEKRRASPEERRGISNHVRALPVVKEPGRARFLIMASLAAVVVVAVAGYAFYAGSTGSPAPQPVPSAQGSAPRPAEPGIETPGDPVMLGRLTLELSRDPDVMPETLTPQGAPAMRDTLPGAIPAARVLSPREPRDDRPVENPVKARDEAPAKAAQMVAPAPARAAAQTKSPPEPAKAPEPGPADIDKQVRRPTAAQQAETEYGRALQSLQQGRTADAREHLDVALRLNAEHVSARQTLLGILVQSKQLPEAERLMQEGLRVLPGQTRFTVTLARLQVDRGDVPSALETLQAGAPHAQGNPEYAAFHGGLLQRRQRHAEAVQQFQQALQARPQTGLWWLGLAMSLQALGQKTEAQDAYRRALGSNNLSAEMQAFADQQLRQLN